MPVTKEGSRPVCSPVIRSREWSLVKVSSGRLDFNNKLLQEGSFQKLKVSEQKLFRQLRATTMCDPESLVSGIHDGHETVIAILPPCNVSTELPECLSCSVVPLLRNDRVDDDMPRFVLHDGLPCLRNGLHDLQYQTGSALLAKDRNGPYMLQDLRMLRESPQNRSSYW